MGRSRDLADGTLAELNVDSNTLAVDATNDIVGIGTTVTTGKLNVSKSGGNSINLIDSSGSSPGIRFANSSNTALGFIEAPAGNGLSFFSGSTERMRIDSSGRVGIGTTSPSATIHAVSPSNGRGLKLQNPSSISASYVTFVSDDGTEDALIGNTASSSGQDNLVMFTGGSERMRIDSSGSLRLGTTTNLGISSKMSIYYDGAGTQYGIIMRPGADNTAPLTFQNAAGSVIGSISTSASSTAYNTSSDYRLKEDWQPMSGSIDRVKQLNPVNFAWKVDGSRVDGFLAHEAQEVVPEAITGTKDAVDADGNPEYQGIDQSKLVPLLTAALQEAITKIESLETEMITVKSRLDALESA